MATEGVVSISECASVVSSDDGTLKTAASNEGKSEKKNWKKPEDMPRRPLSAYNMFFQLRREHILEMSNQGVDTSDSMDIPTFTDAQIEVLVQKHKTKLLQDPKQRKRKHCKTHGKIGFAELARMIAQDWKRVDQTSKQKFEEHAAREKAIYRQRIAAWSEKKKLEEKDKSLKQSSETPNANKEHKETVQVSPETPKFQSMTNPARTDTAPKVSCSNKNNAQTEKPLSLLSLSSNAHKKIKESVAGIAPRQTEPKVDACPSSPSTPVNRSRLRMLLDKATSHDFSPNPLPFADVFSSQDELNDVSLTPLYHRQLNPIDHSLLSDLFPSPIPTRSPCVNLSQHQGSSAPNFLSFSPYELQDHYSNEMSNMCDMVDETFEDAKRSAKSFENCHQINNSNLLLPDEINTPLQFPGSRGNGFFSSQSPVMSQARIQQQQQQEPNLNRTMMMMNQNNNDCINSFQTMNDMMALEHFNPYQSMQVQMQQQPTFMNDCLTCPENQDNTTFFNTQSQNNFNDAMFQNQMQNQPLFR